MCVQTKQLKAQNCKELILHYLLQVKLGALDATVHTIKSNQYGVQGYPTIKFFPPGKKDDSSATEYNGGRTGSDIVNWALEKLAENVPAPEIKQVFTSYVTGKEFICVIFFVTP
jgi:protein disulfide-isomerase A6